MIPQHPFKLSFEMKTTIAKQPKAVIMQSIISVHSLNEVFHQSFDYKFLVGKYVFGPSYMLVFLFKYQNVHNLLTYNNINSVNVLNLISFICNKISYRC